MLLHCCTVALLHSSTIALLHCSTIALLHCCRLLQRTQLVQLRRHALAVDVLNRYFLKI